MSIDLSVITATWRRPQLLSLCLRQFQTQSLGHLRCEQIVVSDGPDDRARRIVDENCATYIERRTNGGFPGGYAKDAGVEAAHGEYLCFWDDDNCYFPHALATLYAAAYGVDVGVVHVLHDEHDRRRLMPAKWDGRPVESEIDTMCFCVRTSLARIYKWSDFADVNCDDFRWIDRIYETGARFRFVPVVIGQHLESPVELRRTSCTT
ncbi:MAG TPA: glycosyltransferase [Planctomycetaceae bacterium]|jgi:GT2 family glycosyltransferase